MSKLPDNNKFLDVSDYGRPFARIISKFLIKTKITPIHVTIGFIISGLLAVFFILIGYYWHAACFLILKSILDATDGELARAKKTPSYTGRYLDSIADILLNALILLSIWYITETPFWITILAFIGMQLQGTLYNYYYVILRNRYNGDTTSRIFEDLSPTAMPGENQVSVDRFFKLYKILYGSFDKVIYKLDKQASLDKNLPKFFMTAVSTFGLGFQLLIISILLVVGLKAFILPFFATYSIMIFLFIAIRKRL